MVSEDVKLLFCILSASLACAGVLFATAEEEVPDFFPKDKPAADGWARLMALPKMTDADKKLLPGIAPDSGDWLEKISPEDVSAVLGRNKALLEGLEKAMATPGLHSDGWRTDDFFGEELLTIMPVLQGMRLMILRDAVAAREQKKPGPAMTTVLRCAGFSLTICEAEPLLIDGLVASTGLVVSTRRLPALAAGENITPEFLRDVARELERIDGRVRAAMRAVVTGEARWALRFTGLLVEGKEKRRELLLNMAAGGQMMEEMLGKAPKTEKASAGETDQEAVLRLWKTKMPERVAEALREAEKMDWKTYLRGQADWFRALRKADTSTVPAFRASFTNPEYGGMLKGTALEERMFVTLGLETDEMYAKLCARTSCALRMAQVVMLLRAFEIKHGGLPAKLDELVPEYGAALPVDPFDGKAIRYDSASRSVWCVGMNLKDDAGKNEPDKTDGADDEVLVLP